MSEDQRAEQGIDLFDFLHELWKVKWLFLSVVLGFLLLGFATAALQRPGNVDGRLVANYEFVVVGSLDPLQRSDAAILDDYLSYFRKANTLALEDARMARGGGAERSYSAVVSETSHRGTFTVNARAVAPPFFDDVHGELDRAALAQVDALRTRVDRDLETLGRVVREYRGGNNEFSATLAFRMLRFQDDPRLAAGDLRLVSFQPFDSATVIRDAPSGNMSLNRRLFVAALLGCVFGVLVVMFRVGIRRKRGRAAV